MLIVRNVLRVSRATSLLTGLRSPTAATCRHIGRGTALRVRWGSALLVGWRVALLSERERGGSKCDSDREAQSFQGAHFALSYLADGATTPVLVPGFPEFDFKVSTRHMNKCSSKQKPWISRWPILRRRAIRRDFFHGVAPFTIPAF
jgi:hypothetical protein